VVDRLVEVGREAAEMRAALRSAREEAREARQDRDEAESRARALSEKVRELEARAEMAESNLRTMLATVRAKNAEDPARDARVSDSEMEAILGVLKGDDTLEAPGVAAPGPETV
jgi:chromosome segregation ATPase